MKKISSVIFDVDGTMVDNMPYHKQAWLAFGKKHGIILTEEDFSSKINGRKNAQIFEQLFNHLLTDGEREKFIEEKEALYREIYKPHINEVKGLNRLIQKLHNEGFTLGVATTAPRKNRDFILESLGLTKMFSVVLGDEHVTNGKPDPEIFLKVSKKLHETPSNILVFEDSPVGVEAGKRAGMSVVGIRTQHNQTQLARADATINNYDEFTFELLS